MRRSRPSIASTRTRRPVGTTAKSGAAWASRPESRGASATTTRAKTAAAPSTSGSDAPARQARGRQVRARRRPPRARPRRRATRSGRGARLSTRPTSERGRRAEQARPPEVRAPPQRDVGHGEDRDGDAHVARQVGPGLAAAPPRPGGEEAAGEGDHAREEREGDDEVERQHQQVARLGEQPPVEARRREGRGQAEEHAAHEPDARRRARATRRAVSRPRRPQHEAVERAVEVAEPPQLLADRLDGRERRSLARPSGQPAPAEAVDDRGVDAVRRERVADAARRRGHVDSRCVLGRDEVLAELVDPGQVEQQRRRG